MNKKLYAEFRVYFSPDTNQELLREVCNSAQERIYDLFDGIDDETSGPLPAPLDVTYEIVMDCNSLTLQSEMYSEVKK